MVEKGRREIIATPRKGLDSLPSIFSPPFPTGYPWPTYTIKCVERGAACTAPAIGTPGVIQVTTRNGTALTGVSTPVPGCHYLDCYVIASNNLGTSCSLLPAANVLTMNIQNFGERQRGREGKRREF